MEIKFKIKLNRSTFDPRILLDINNSNLGVIRIDRFGSSEPLKNVFSSSNENRIVEIWDEYWGILFKNKKDFNFYAQADRTGLINCTGNLKVKSYADEKVKSLIEFIDLFKKNDSLIFAFFIDEENYDLKHKVIDEYSYGWKGASNQEFFDYLPGIYWYNAYGKEYIACIGEQKLKNVNGVVYTHTEKDGIAFHLAEPISNESSVLNELENIEKQIGENYFFSKNRKLENPKHPKGFKEFLLSLEMK